MVARDNQRKRFYEAWDSIGPVGETLFRKHEVEDFVLEIVGTVWWKNRSDIRDFEIEFFKGSRLYLPVPNRRKVAELKLDRPPSSKGDVLIRVCQALRPAEAAWHGPELCRALLDAVGRFCGDNEKKRLQTAFLAYRVKHRVVSDAARAAARERWEKRKISTNQQTKASSELADWLKELKD